MRCYMLLVLLFHFWYYRSKCLLKNNNYIARGSKKLLSNLPGVKARDFTRKLKKKSFWILNINVDVNSAFIYVDMVEAGTRVVKGYI